MKRLVLTLALTMGAACSLWAARTAPWSKEKAWAWYNAQPWMRGCNYLPASAANYADMWQELGSEERTAYEISALTALIPEENC